MATRLDIANVQQRLRGYLAILDNDVGQLLKETSEDRERIEEYKSDIEKSNRAYKSLAEDLKRLEIEKAQLESYSAGLEQRIFDLENGRRVYCLIDGDQAIFSSSLLLRGEEGGKDAAAQLAKEIQVYLQESNMELYIYVFVNKRGLQSAMHKAGLYEEAANFDSFFAGFNQANERFLMVDVGHGKEMADARMRSYLNDYCRTPYSWKIFFGGCHDNGYAFPLQSLITSGLKEKIVLLPSYTEVASAFKGLGLPMLTTDNLFLPDKLVASVLPASPTRTTQRITPTTPANGVPNGMSSPPKPGMDNPKAVAHNSFGSGGIVGGFMVMQKPKPKPATLKKLTPGVPLLKHNPRPCNMFYLSGDCKFGGGCTYGHNYLLEAEHYEEMRENARRAPCPHVNSNATCAYGEKCIYGHRCPQGPKCFYRMQGKCKFVGDVMHKPE